MNPVALSALSLTRNTTASLTSGGRLGSAPQGLEVGISGRASGLHFVGQPELMGDQCVGALLSFAGGGAAVLIFVPPHSGFLNAGSASSVWAHSPGVWTYTPRAHNRKELFLGMFSSVLLAP